FFRLPQILWNCVAVVACRGEFVKIRTPNVAAAGHAERVEDQLGHYIVQRLAFDLLYDALEINKSLAGIAESLTRREMKCKRVRAPPVGKAGPMAQHDARRDFL